LIEGLDRGNAGLRSRFYDRLIDIVDSTLYRILRERGHDHDDLVQSAFEQIIRSLMRRQLGRARSLSSWACSSRRMWRSTRCAPASRERSAH